MPETPEEFHVRVAGTLRTPPVETWDTWPFEGGVDCGRCTAGDDEYIWTNERWRLFAPPEPSGLPIVVLLEPREHLDAPGELPDDLAAELGLLIARIERAISSVDGIGRVHIGRWGEGGAHMHWWFMGRPEGMEQLRSSFAAVWDDVLPPTPGDVWRANLDTVVSALVGGA